MENLEQKIVDLEKKLAFSESQRLLYENGDAKLYYALQRKMNEMAELLNRTSLLALNLDDKESKAFERLKVIWNDSASLAEAVKNLGISTGVTVEQKEVVKKPFVETIAEPRR